MIDKTKNYVMQHFN